MSANNSSVGLQAAFLNCVGITQSYLLGEAKYETNDQNFTNQNCENASKGHQCNKYSQEVKPSEQLELFLYTAYVCC